MTKAFHPAPAPCRVRGKTIWEVDCRPWAALMNRLGEPKRRRFKSEEAARDWCQDLIVARKMGRKIASQEVAVSSFVDRFLRACDRSDKAPLTVKLYGDVLIKSFSPFMREVGCDYLDQVSPLQIEEYRQHLASFCAPATVRTWMTIVRAAFTWGVKLNLFDANPVKGLVPKAVPSDKRSLTDAERKLIITKAPSRDIWLAYLLTGLRASEFGNLPVAAVKVVHDSAAHLVVKGKGSKKRIVYLEGQAIEHFRKLVATAQARDDVMVAPCRTNTLQGRWIKERDELGLPPDISIHTFRHTYGTYMAQRDLVGTQRAMGHSKITTTMGYVHPDDRLIRETSAQWSAALHRDKQSGGTKSVPESERVNGTNGKG